MAVVNNEPGFTQLDKLNVTQSLLINGMPVTSNLTVQQTVFSAQSTADDQQPTALNTPIQIEFGPAQSETDASIDASGTTTFNISGLYVLTFVFNTGREGTSGTVALFGRILIDDVQSGESIYQAISNQNDGIPLVVTLSGSFNAGQTIKFELLRDSSGNNNGGVFRRDPTLAGWNTSACARLTLSKLVPSSEGFSINSQP